MAADACGVGDGRGGARSATKGEKRVEEPRPEGASPLALSTPPPPLPPLASVAASPHRYAVGDGQSKARKHASSHPTVTTAGEPTVTSASVLQRGGRGETTCPPCCATHTRERAHTHTQAHGRAATARHSLFRHGCVRDDMRHLVTALHHPGRASQAQKGNQPAFAIPGEPHELHPAATQVHVRPHMSRAPREAFQRRRRGRDEQLVRQLGLLHLEAILQFPLPLAAALQLRHAPCAGGDGTGARGCHAGCRHHRRPRHHATRLHVLPRHVDAELAARAFGGVLPTVAAVHCGRSPELVLARRQRHGGRARPAEAWPVVVSAGVVIREAPLRGAPVASRRWLLRTMRRVLRGARSAQVPKSGVAEFSLEAAVTTTAVA